MKVLLVHNGYQRPGGEDVVFEQERSLLERAGHQVVLYHRSNWEVERYSGAKRLALARNTIWNSASRREIAKLIAREKPDVAHVHNTFVVVSPSIFSACQAGGVPVVLTLHNYRLLCPAATFFRDGKICQECVEHDLSRSIRHACYHNSRATTAVVALMLTLNHWRRTWTDGVNRFVALTDFARKKFIEGGLPAEKILVKPNFVHPDPGARTEGGEYAVFVGRLSPEKRVSTLLAAWGRLHSSQIPLLVIGTGPQQDELQAEAARLNLWAIRFEGQATRERAIAAIKRARFLVFSSEWYENFPVTIGEAFACSTPVICSKMGAMEEIVEDGRTGLHFMPGNAEDLAHKAEWAWSHPEAMREMGAEARREYETKYTAEKNYPLLMKIYEEARTAGA